MQYAVFEKNNENEHGVKFRIMCYALNNNNNKIKELRAYS